MKVRYPAKAVWFCIVWLVAFSAIAGIVVWLLATAMIGTITFAILGIGLSVVAVLHRIGYTVEITDRVLSVKRGFFISRIHKMPLRFIVSTTIINTPLSLAMNLSVMTITTSGSLIMIAALKSEDAENLRQLLSERQG